MMVKKWNRAKIFMTAFVATGSILGNQTAIYAQEEQPLIYTGDEKDSKQSNMIAPQVHRKNEILKFYLEHPYDISKEVTYQKKPELSPCTAGKLSQETTTDGLNALNFMRYIAGLPADVTIKEEYDELAQTGSVLMAKNDHLSHQPERPSDVPKEFFEKGSKGTAESNIGYGYTNISASIVNGYVNDGDAGNIDRVGHRRWILNPTMMYTGFGYCKNENTGNKFTALYAFDTSRKDYAVDYVAWPAVNMPYEVMSGPWMVSLSKQKFFLDESNKNNVKVTLTDLKTKQTIEFNNSTNQVAGKTPYFNIDLGGYGMGPALIFSPERTFSVGDQIQVKVSGLKDKGGNAAEIEYTVNFFSLQETNRESVKAPKADLNQATYRVEKNVALSCDTKDAEIYYTLDGSEPTTSSLKYTKPILLTGAKGKTETIVIKAIAIKDGMNDSTTSSFTYRIELPAKSYPLTVSYGTGGGSHKEGSTVTITADIPAAGKKFKGWKVEKGTVTLANSASATTTFTMPSEAVTIKAEYEDATIDPSAPTYAVTVKNGSGGGTYPAGTVVSIKADKAKSGMQFDCWKVVSGSAVLADSKKESTRFVMTEGIVTVEATYKKKSSSGSSSGSSGSSGSSRPSGGNNFGTNYGPGSVQQYRPTILTSSAGKQFQKSNGSIAVNEWVKDQNTWYYAGADSMLKTGWLKTGDGKWYYLAGNCAMTTGWQLVNGKWYFLDTINGDMKVGWQRVNEKWYYLDPVNGDMKSAWQKVNGKWYYLDPKNGDMKAAWQFVNGKWYYLNPVDGDMKTDWQLVNGKWYYLDPVNGDMKTGWQLVRGKWYYMDEKNGDCLINTVTPDGYRVDENGAWVH